MKPVRTGGAFVAALLAAAATAACGGESEPSGQPQGVVEDCSTQSRADFGGAFSDPANLVVGPLLLVGGATPTPADVVESTGGNKFPLLVREGHTVTVQVPEEARAHAALGYGPLPQGEVGVRDGHDTVTFVACDEADPSGSTGDVPVTFWSGFLLADRLACVPLDVWADDAAEPTRVEIELGEDC